MLRRSMFCAWCKRGSTACCQAKTFATTRANRSENDRDGAREATIRDGSPAKEAAGDRRSLALDRAPRGARERGGVRGRPRGGPHPVRLGLPRRLVGDLLAARYEPGLSPGVRALRT